MFAYLELFPGLWRLQQKRIPSSPLSGLSGPAPAPLPPRGHTGPPTPSAALSLALDFCEGTPGLLSLLY